MTVLDLLIEEYRELRHRARQLTRLNAARRRRGLLEFSDWRDYLDSIEDDRYRRSHASDGS